MTTPVVIYFHSATSSLWASATIVDLHFNVGLGAFEPIFGTSIETFAGRVSIEMPFSSGQASGEHGFPLQDGLPGFDIFASCRLAVQCGTPAEQEVAIDLLATHKELVEIEKQIRASTAKHNAFLKELGLSPLPAPDQ